MITSSILAVQGELLIVHLKVAAPTTSPVTPEVGLVGEVTTAVPATTVHAPVPFTGVFPVSVAVAAQTVWSAPAAETVGAVLTAIVIPVEVAGEPVTQVRLEVITQVTTSPFARVAGAKVALFVPAFTPFT